MKVIACSNARVNTTNNTAAPRCKVVKPPKIEPKFEPDYGKNMKQLSYVVGMSILSVASLIFATRGKTSLNIKV